MLVKKAQGQCPNKFLSGKKSDMSLTIKSLNLKKNTQRYQIFNRNDTDSW